METNAQPNFRSLEQIAEELAESEAPYKPAQAFQLFTEGRYTQALALCNEVESETETPPISADLISARCHLALARFAEAAESFHQALTIDPENSVALKGLGDVHYARGSTEVALSYYDRVAELSAECALLSQDLAAPECRALHDRFLRNQPPAELAESKETPEQTTPADTLPNLPKIEVTETANKEAEEEKGTDIAPAAPQSVTIKRPAESSTQSLTEPEPVRRKSSGRLPKDFPRYDRLNLPQHYQTETMADLLIRQGHHRAAMDILRELVKQNASPKLVEKLKSAQEMAGKRGR